MLLASIASVLKRGYESRLTLLDKSGFRVETNGTAREKEGGRRKRRRDELDKHWGGAAWQATARKTEASGRIKPRPSSSSRESEDEDVDVKLSKLLRWMGSDFVKA
nr:PREDICTED: uncharacterized protein LOC106704762 [Latimeria chalumnae]|eukprot:XP_014347972.1 PREDICTED: uncharacterized protein LOC106704762 [Latimeria chalumnae]